MTINDVMNRVLNNTGILDVELTQPILQEIADRALGDLNKFYPMVLRGNAGPNGVLRSYEDQWRTGYSDPFDLGLWQIGLQFWDLDLIDTDPVTQQDFIHLLIGYAKVMIGEKRRSIKMEGLPYDLNGEVMVTEGNNLIDKTCHSLANRFSNAV